MFKENIKYYIIVLLVSIFLAYNFYIVDNSANEEPAIEGDVYELNEDSFLVAENLNADQYEDSEDLEGEAIMFTVTENTNLKHQGEEISFEDLNLKDKVKVWTTGPVKESYPAQADAEKVEVVERNESDDGEEVKMDSFEDSEFKITFDKPEDASVTYENERLKITYVGEDSSNGELTDGFTFFIDVLETGDPVENVARKTMDDMEFAEIVSTISEEKIDDLEGQSFTIKTGLENETKYFIYELEDRVISTSQTIINPNEKDYEEIVEDILLSIDFQDSARAEKECKVSGCSGEICGSETKETTCEALPGASCLDEASCEFTEDECKWVLSEEAAKCLMEAEDEFGSEARDTRIGHLFEEAEEVLD